MQKIITFESLIHTLVAHVGNRGCDSVGTHHCFMFLGILVHTMIFVVVGLKMENSQHL